MRLGNALISRRCYDPLVYCDATTKEQTPAGKEIAKAMRRTAGALRQKTLSLGLPRAIAGEPGLMVFVLGDDYCAV